MQTPWRVKSLLVPVLLACVVLAVHGWYFRHKIPEVSMEAFEKNAVLLRAEPKWSVGYFSGIHGAVLVKALNAGPPPSIARSGNAELDRVMADELSGVPRRFALEALLYIALVGWCFVVVPRLALSLEQLRLFRSRRSTIAGLMAALTVSIAVFPMFALSYGGSAFSTWAGPGAMSSSGPYLGSFGRNAGETVSYRPFVELVLLVPAYLGSFLAAAAEAFLRSDFWLVAEEFLPGTDGTEVFWSAFNWVNTLGVYCLLGLLGSKAYQKWLAA